MPSWRYVSDEGYGSQFRSIVITRAGYPPLEASTVFIGRFKSDGDYRLALEEIERLMSAKAVSSEGERLDVLVARVEAWERKHYPLSKPD